MYTFKYRLSENVFIKALADALSVCLVSGSNGTNDGVWMFFNPE